MIRRLIEEMVMGKKRKLRIPEDLVVGSVHESKNYGSMEIVEYRGCNDITITFLRSKGSRVATAKNIRGGTVRDTSAYVVPTKMNCGDLYKSNNYGVMEITECIDSSKVRVSFISTGYTTLTSPTAVRNGLVRDKSIPKANNFLKIGEVYPTKHSGDVKVINFLSAKEIEVYCLRDGITLITDSASIRKGRVLHSLSTTICNIGYHGDGPHLATESNLTYKRWKNIINRCYSSADPNHVKYYGDCSVCEEWLNFQNFADWFESNSFEGCQVDKDILFEGNKVYSPETCICVGKTDNIVKAHAGHFKMVNPQGELVEIYNMRAYCREHNLDHRRLCYVHSGEKYSHGGWTKYVEK